MAIYRARADLGWSATAANVNTQLSNAINNILQSGDTLHLDGRDASGNPALFKVSTRNNRFPAGITITADTGCGFDGIGASSGSGQPWFENVGAITVDNVEFAHTGAIETGYGLGPIPQNNPGSAGGNYSAGQTWKLRGSSPKIFRFCKFTGNVDNHMNASGSGYDIRNTSFYRSKYQFYCEAAVTGLYLKHCFFNDALIDGIKTINAATVPTGWLVEDTIFQYSRDGVDIAGGLTNSTFNRCTFRFLSVTGFDAKIGLDVGTSAAQWNTRLCRDLTFNDCLFIDLNSAVCFTLLNGGGFNLTPTILETYAPQNITLNRCTFERSTDTVNRPANAGLEIFLVKMGHHGYALNSIKRNWNSNDQELHITDEVGGAPSGTQQFDGWSHDLIVTTATINPSGRARDLSIPFPIGPGGVLPEDPEDPEDPVIPAAPVSEGPAVYVNSVTGLLTVDTDRTGTLAAESITINAGSVSDVITLTVD